MVLDTTTNGIVYEVLARNEAYRAKPSAQLSKHIKSIQDDIKHALMKQHKLELE